MFFGVYMTRSSRFKDKIITSKKVKEDIVNNLLKNLDALHYLTVKILRDKEIIGVYNTETLILSMQTVVKNEKLEEAFDNLNDNSLSTIVSNYNDDMKAVLVDIYNMETNLYENKKSSEQLILTYDRQFSKLNADFETNNSEGIYELKQRFKKEMSEYKGKINELEETSKARREDFASDLNKLNTKNGQIQSILEDYKKKNVETKKLYIKQLVYA